MASISRPLDKTEIRLVIFSKEMSSLLPSRFVTAIVETLAPTCSLSCAVL